MIPLLAATAIVGATIVNLDGGPHLSNAVVVIEGERIRAIEGAAPAGAGLIKLIRADGLYLLPGLVNLHVHLGLVLPGKMAAELADETEAELALRMASNARKSLEAGVTTIRIPGDARHADIALKGASNGVSFAGPASAAPGRWPTSPRATVRTVRPHTERFGSARDCMGDERRRGNSRSIGRQPMTARSPERR